MCKLAGCLLIIVGGILTAAQFLKPCQKNLRLLEEGTYLFRVMESEIQSAKLPLPLLFARLGEKTESRWRIFF